MEKAELYYQVTQDRLQSQEGLNAEYVTKAFRLLALGAALAGAGVIVLNLPTAKPELSTCVVISLTVVTGTSLLASMISGLLVILPKTWHRNPRPEDMKHYMETHSDDVLVKWVGDCYTDAITKNRQVVESKAGWFRWSSISLLIGVVTLLALGFYILAKTYL